MPYDPAPANAARLKMYQLIADKLERQPELLDVGLENVARWIANGSTQQDKLREWERLILLAKESPEGMADLQRALREDTERRNFSGISRRSRACWIQRREDSSARYAHTDIRGHHIKPCRIRICQAFLQTNDLFARKR